MTLKQYTFDSGTSGTTLTTANTGASLIFTTGGGVAVFDSASGARGMGVKFTSGTNAAGCFGQFDAAASNMTFSASVVITLPAAAPSSGAYTLAQLWNAGGNRALTFQLNFNGHLGIVDRGNTTRADWGGTSGGTITLGAKYRLNVWGVVGTTTTGTLNAKLYNSAGTQVGSTINVTGINLDSAAVTAWRVGAINDASGALAVGVDDIQIDDGGTTELAPITNTPPTVTVTGNQNVAASESVSVTATASDPDGSIATYAWTVVTAKSTATPTLSGASTATASFTAPAAGNVVTLQCVVTDNDGGSTTVTTEVRVPISTDFTTLAKDFGPNPAWTMIGAAATKGAALADALDTTGSQSPAYTSTETEERHRLQPLTPRSTLAITFRSLVSATGGTTKARLYEGNTLRQEWALTQSTTAADQMCTVSTPANISDWGNLWVAVAAVS